jgi:hypothetical protein
VIAPGFSWPLQVGQMVTAEHDLTASDIVPPSRILTIRADGALVFYGIEDLDRVAPPAELMFEDGEQLCYLEDELCDSAGFELVVHAGGAQGTLVPGDVAEVGGFEVHLGENSTIYSNGGCDSGSFSRMLFVVPSH